MALRYEIKNEGRSGLPPSAPPVIEPVCCKMTLPPTPDILAAYVNTFIYVWLVQGCAFWMFPKKIHNNLLCGYIWSGESWEPASLSYKLIDRIY